MFGGDIGIERGKIEKCCLESLIFWEMVWVKGVGK